MIDRVLCLRVLPDGAPRVGAQLRKEFKFSDALEAFQHRHAGADCYIKYRL